MAVMDPSEAQQLAGQETVSPEDLAKELGQRKDEDLQEMGRRLEASTTNMQSLFDDLQTENVALEDENKQLKETIELMMRELRKLNISSSNTVEPMLVGGDNPLNAVGRWWEKVRPRDTAVQVDEHTGELRKQEEGAPNAREELSRKVSDLGNQLSDQVGQRAQELGQKAQEAQGVLGQKAQEAQQKAQEVGQRAQEASGEALTKLHTSVGPTLGSLWQTGEGLWNSISAAAQEGTETQRSRKKASKQVVTGDETPTSSGQGSVAAEETFPSEQEKAEQEKAEREKVAPAAAPPAAQPDLKSAEAEEQISATILIEAQLRFEDGSVHPLQVCAADRAKEVSKRFVQEHSLKVWFQDPLTKWLKQVEEDAEHYPVQVEADLEEIRQQYSKRAAA